MYGCDAFVGDSDGERDGVDVDGDSDGECEGNESDGERDGVCEGEREGDSDGERDGESDGEIDGEWEGRCEGECVGVVGESVGESVGGVGRGVEQRPDCHSHGAFAHDGKHRDSSTCMNGEHPVAQSIFIEKSCAACAAGSVQLHSHTVDGAEKGGAAGSGRAGAGSQKGIPDAGTLGWQRMTVAQRAVGSESHGTGEAS